MMEQSVVCGLLGYYEFLTPRRLSNIIHWQRSTGCYGNIENENDLGQHQTRRTMRKLLMGKELAGEIVKVINLCYLLYYFCAFSQQQSIRNDAHAPFALLMIARALDVPMIMVLLFFYFSRHGARKAYMQFKCQTSNRFFYLDTLPNFQGMGLYSCAFGTQLLYYDLGSAVYSHVTIFILFFRRWMRITYNRSWYCTAIDLFSLPDSERHARRKFKYDEDKDMNEDFTDCLP